MAKRPARHLSNLPADLTSFVDRRPEISAVRRLLSEARLVTLVGIGGVGKTRLALRIAQEVRRVFADGVWLVELEALRDPTLLPHTVLDALDVREQSTRTPLAVLCDYLRERHTLLVLDNCEHMPEATADLVDRLLRTAPRLRILATSRQVLRIAGEQVHPVPALPTPDPDEAVESGAAIRYPALALFVDRATAVLPTFDITSQNEAAAIKLCHRLEGLPLAIELAAVQLRVLSVNELADRLDDRFQVLSEGNRNLPERHQTLAALVDWSHELCTPLEQTLWARASVFAGGFSIESLEDVCADDELPREALSHTVGGLLDKSIFMREEHGRQVRFRMLDTIREYGQARLRQAGSEPVLRRQHRDWCLQLIERAAVEWFGQSQQDWATRLKLEHANVRAALEYCLARPAGERHGLRMAGVAQFFWIGLGHMTEGRTWLERLLTQSDEPSPDRARALATNGLIAILQGDKAVGAALVEDARKLAVHLDDPAVLGYATHLRGMCEFFNTDLSRAIPLFIEALDRYEVTDVPEDFRSGARIQLTLAYILLGEVEKATEVVGVLYRRCEDVGEVYFLSYAMWLQGLIELERGNLSQADAELSESLRAKRIFYDPFGLAFALETLAWVSAAMGAPERAAVLFGSADQLWQTIGAPLAGAMRPLERRAQYEATARETMGDAAYEAALARGRGFTLQETLAFALRERGQRTAVDSPEIRTELTRREREVADLVADGMTNKDVAERLLISVRTAEGHVEHILAKLGFTSRAQIASWVSQQRTTAAGLA